MNTKEKHLYYLNELKDYKVDRKDPDIRGWSVKDLDNRVIGKVDNLLVNKERGKVVYVDVEVDQSIIDAKHDPYSSQPNSEVKEFINKEGENHIIIPVGLIDLNVDNKYVYTESINYQTFAETKRYRSGSHISRDYEHHVLDSYDRRRDRLNHENELRRTKTAYTDSELEERNFRDEDVRPNHEERSKNDSIVEDTEGKIRMEKENLRYKSDDRSKPIDDHNRASHHHETSNDLHPERTVDEDNNWVHDNRNLEDEDYRTSRRENTRANEEFYDRREFRDRDYR
ncbi:PRC-barrel domain-containing protein [Christiangramia sp.]|uniref:PRC-barrel domain-containing protein n=1 Tax=Christiangramia sp. TaxID=1931228 RepID=UPI0026217FE8|nr:PRC-barrel domain-containing protein [Christiangramia sp.]